MLFSGKVKKVGDIQMATIKKIEYMCRYCGTKEIKTNLQGRPMPGRCPRKSGDKPHSWVKNRELL